MEGLQAHKKKIRISLVLGLLLCLLAASVVLAIGIGSVFIPPDRVVKALLSPVDLTNADSIIVHNMRLCRVAASMVGGAALALAGLLLQILFNNPIADPYVLGVSSGSFCEAYRKAFCIRSNACFSGILKFNSPNGVFMVISIVFPPALCIPKLVDNALSIRRISATVTLPMYRSSLLLHTVTICSQRAIDGRSAELI